MKEYAEEVGGRNWREKKCEGARVQVFLTDEEEEGNPSAFK